MFFTLTYVAFWCGITCFDNKFLFPTNTLYNTLQCSRLQYFPLQGNHLCRWKNNFMLHFNGFQLRGIKSNQMTVQYLPLFFYGDNLSRWKNNFMLYFNGSQLRGIKSNQMTV